jgi:hypothetical protein
MYSNFSWCFSSGIQSVTTHGKFDGFVCKLSRNGQLQWVKQLGGGDRNMVNSVVADQQGNV